MLFVSLHAGSTATVCNRPLHWAGRHGLHHYGDVIIMSRSAKAASKSVGETVERSVNFTAFVAVNTGNVHF